MDISKFPWEQGIGIIFGIVLLKIMADAVYKKIPRGFRLIESRLVKIETAVMQVHEDNQEIMRRLEAKNAAPQKLKRLPKTRPGRRGGGGTNGRA